MLEKAGFTLLGEIDDEHEGATLRAGSGNWCLTASGVRSAPVVGPLDRALYQELRLALVFNGGVSLAVWMGGVAKELDRFRCALARDGEELGPYRDLLDALRSELVTDVIAGTSAGGINGALLAYVVANGKSLECAGANAIRDTWREIGSIQNLLAEEGEARSAFNDKVLFRGCAKVFAQLKDAQPDLGAEASRRVRLTVTATDSDGYPLSVDEVAGRDHRLAMRFRHVERPSGDELRLSGELVAAVAQVAGPSALGTWPFPAAPSPRDLDGEAAPALLARAARTTASFPIAFGPSTLPLDWTTDALSDDPGGLTATPRMDGVLETRGGKPFDPGPGPKSSRFAIDGGLWDNSPFSAVLRAIDRTPSDRDVARRVTYVVATSDPPPKAAAQQAPGLVASVTQAVALPANVAFANDLERIEADLGQQERRREIVPRLLGEGPPDLFRTGRRAVSPVSRAADRRMARWARLRSTRCPDRRRRRPRAGRRPAGTGAGESNPCASPSRRRAGCSARCCASWPRTPRRTAGLSPACSRCGTCCPSWPGS